jgi:hypothetical protein
MDQLTRQARAARLLHLTTSPGFADLRQIIDIIVQESADAWNQFEGWDKDQMAALGIIYQTSRKFGNQIFQRISEGIVDSAANQGDNRGDTPADYESLQRMIEARPGGSY